MIALCAEPLALEPLIAAVRDDGHGAIVTFVGVTRVTSNGDPRPVAALEYEAYAALALREMEAIAAEAQARFGPLRIAIVHRTGRVDLGEPSVAIAVGTPHRPQAFAACAFAIDALKARVEIWKNECYADGASAWRPNAEAAP
jgi:molybdopterin synthase catalytic subunit